MGKVAKTDHILKVPEGKIPRVGLKRAAQIILSGGVVAFPTESFYGLAVNVANGKAIRRLFEIKERQDDHPILILIPDLEMLDEYVNHIPDHAQILMDRFWPGGLTSQRRWRGWKGLTRYPRPLLQSGRLMRGRLQNFP